jgi:hypothetical protein
MFLLCDLSIGMATLFLDLGGHLKNCIRGYSYIPVLTSRDAFIVNSLSTLALRYLQGSALKPRINTIEFGQIRPNPPVVFKNRPYISLLTSRTGFITSGREFECFLDFPSFELTLPRNPRDRFFELPLEWQD